MNTFILCRWTHGGNGIFIVSVSQNLEQIKKDLEIESFDIEPSKNVFVIEEWATFPEPERKAIYYHAEFAELFDERLNNANS